MRARGGPSGLFAGILTLLLITGVLALGGGPVAAAARPDPIAPGGVGETVPSGTKFVLDHGHIDVLAPVLDGRSLRIESKDGSVPGAPVKWRDPEDLVLHVRPQTTFTVPDRPDFAEIGTPGQTLWTIRQQETELATTVWAGWSTEVIDPPGHAQFAGDHLDWRLDAVDGPGVAALWMNATFGAGPRMLLDGAKPLPQSTPMAVFTHSHVNWTFSAQGVYRMTFTVAGALTDSTPVSDTVTLALAVGDVDPSGVAPGDGTPPPTSSTAPTSPTAPTQPTSSSGPSSTPSTPAPSTKPGAPRDDLEPAAIVLDSGHVDAVAPRLASDGRLRVDIKDSTGLGGAGVPEPAWRSPDRTVFHVRPAARQTVPDDPVFAFLGRAGAPVWLIPQTQDPGIVWAGWSTEALAPDRVPAGVDWSLDSIEGPGSVALFQNDAAGGIASTVFDSRKALPQSVHVALGLHAHANWAFSAEGLYHLNFTVASASPDGRPLRDTEVYHFAVGNVDPRAAFPPGVTPGPNPSTSDSARPSGNGGGPTPSAPVSRDAGAENRGLARTGVERGTFVALGLGTILAGTGLLALVRRRRHSDRRDPWT
ncbi:choice-of-anchor M domain-containing protein [Amycolatopsis sp. PS_44_ISF1]|uniref:choice-of-anchor M domain-containing protein n=1 Tax=Amycolatopsis sp. PS_44_ISF1 TaxID=2974917 RepID=UPI0028DF1AEC|nr:choice-of-anchor M domain-containing protein [Amycolatopsis sp. PS_44_ISF1]MDT8914959.1 choice-of-anchor M domain-containing protein [Amycolatopsis sp. PS_44_ISF1]